jgi:hypothetical protein
MAFTQIGFLVFDGVVPKGAGGMAIPGSISTSAVGREELS